VGVCCDIITYRSSSTCCFVGESISVYNESHRSTQPGHPFTGKRREYQPKGGDALWPGSKGRYGSWVGGR